MSTVASETPLAPPAPGILGGIANILAEWGGSAIDAVSTVGDLTLFSFKTLAWLFTRAPKPGTLLPNFYQVGVLSLPVIALTGTFIGMVLAVQSYFTFRDLKLETRLGAVINMTLVRELGPVLAATMLAGRDEPVVGVVRGFVAAQAGPEPRASFPSGDRPTCPSDEGLS